MNADSIYKPLSELRRLRRLLGDALEPGTPRPWGSRDLSFREREVLDYQAFQEKAAKVVNTRRGLSAIGESKAPLRISVLDSSALIVAGIAEMERCICEWLEITPLAGATPDARLARILDLVDRIATLDELAAWVQDEAVRLCRQARRALGDTEQINKIDAPCLLCGMYSLRAFPERDYVACVYSQCRCGSVDCPCVDDPRPGLHKWHDRQWIKLARDLDAGEKRPA